MDKADSILRKHCHVVYNEQTGEEEVEAFLPAVIIAMEEYHQLKSKEEAGEKHQNKCHSCGEPMSNDCPRCKHLWET